MAWKRIAGVGVAGTVGVGMLLAAVNTASAAGDYPEKAFALQVKAAGQNVLAPTPYVESPDGDLVKKRLVSIPSRDNDPLLSLPLDDSAPIDVGVLEALAEKDHAHARVASLDLGAGGGITAKAVTSTCKKAEGTTEIVNLQVADNDLSGIVANPSPNTKIGVPGLLEITLNEQYTNSDDSLTVNAVHVAVAPDLNPAQFTAMTDALAAAGGLEANAGMTQLSELTSLKGDVQSGLRETKAAPSEGLVDVVVASATCGDNSSSDDGDDDDDDDDDGDDGGDDGGDAPTPTPVPTNHPVTG